MNEFWSNELLSSSFNFVWVLLAFLIIFHLILVWPRNLTKKTWKKVDYLWLIVAVIGMLGLASDVRVSVASNWESIEKNRALAILDGIDFLADNPENNHFCIKLVKKDSSPENFDEIQNQYTLGCIWRRSLSEFWKGINQNELPEIKFDDFPEPTFDERILNETVSWLKELIVKYEKQRDVWIKTKKLTRKKDWEEMLGYYSLFFLCVALALRLTKVTGEVLHEKN